MYMFLGLAVSRFIGYLAFVQFEESWKQLLRGDESNLGELANPEVVPVHGPDGVSRGLTSGLLVEEGWRKMSNSPAYGLKFLVSRGI